MSMNEIQKDQAEQLRKRMQQEENDEAKLDEKDAPFDVSSLPPRSAVHKGKKKQSKHKLKYPLIRLLVFFFILLPFVVLSIYTYSMSNLRTGNDRDDYERLNVEQNIDGEENGELSIHEEGEE